MSIPKAMEPKFLDITLERELTLHMSTATKKTDPRMKLPKNARKTDVVLELGDFIAVNWHVWHKSEWPPFANKDNEWKENYKACHANGLQTPHCSCPSKVSDSS